MKKFIIFLILIISLIFLYGKYIEPNNFKIKEYSVIDTNIPESFNGYKIIHLTDLYYENKDLTSIIDKINNLNPDLVVFTGNLLHDKFNPDQKETLINYLNSIKSTYGIYAVKGNNDNNEIYNEIINSTNIKILFANGIIKKHKQKTMIDMVDAYKQMNDVFSTAKTEFSGMPKPIKRDVEVSKAEQDNIRQAVYEALSNTDDKEVEKYASSFDKKEETIDDVIRNSNYSENKEKKLDDFFNNVSSGKSHDKLDNESLGQVLNKGKVKEKESKSLENKQLDEVLNGGKPVFSNLTNNTSIFDGSPTISSTGYIGKNDSRKNADYDKMLADDDIVSLTDRLTKNKENLVFNKPLSNNEYVEIGESSVPNVVDLRAKLDESINEIERKRQAKEEARKKYEAEKQAREQEENELSESKRLIAEMRKEIERKREEQKAIEELNQKVEKALKYQRQIEENRRAALEEEEEARKYQETLRIEKENQTKVAQEKEKLQSERVVLQSETSKVDSSLQKEKEKLEEARRQLQMFNTSMNVAEVSTNAYSQIEPFDVKHDDFFAKFNAQPSKRR